jgi:hypothetical protein
MPAAAELRSKPFPCGAATFGTLALESTGGALRIPGGGVSFLVVLECRNVGGFTRSGTAVLFGCTPHGRRIPIGVCYPGPGLGVSASAWPKGNPMAWAAFMVSGLPFDHFEIDVHGEAGMEITAIVMMSAFGGGPPSVRIGSEIAVKPRGGYWSKVDLPSGGAFYGPFMREMLSAEAPKLWNLVPVTASDTLDIALVADGIHLSADGSVKLTLGDGDEATLTLSGGVVHNIPFRRLWTTTAYAGTVHAAYEARGIGTESTLTSVL